MKRERTKERGSLVDLNIFAYHLHDTTFIHYSTHGSYDGILSGIGDIGRVRLHVGYMSCCV